MCPTRDPRGVGEGKAIVCVSPYLTFFCFTETPSREPWVVVGETAENPPAAWAWGEFLLRRGAPPQQALLPGEGVTMGVQRNYCKA